MLALPHQQRGWDGRGALHKAPSRGWHCCSCLAAPWKTPSLQCLPLFYNSEPDQRKKPSSPRCLLTTSREMIRRLSCLSQQYPHTQERVAQKMEKITREQEKCSQALGKDTIYSRGLRSSSLHVGLWKSTEKYLGSLNIWPLGDLEDLYKQKEKSKADIINCELVSSHCRVEKSLSLRPPDLCHGSGLYWGRGSKLW